MVQSWNKLDFQLISDSLIPLYSKESRRQGIFVTSIIDSLSTWYLQPNNQEIEHWDNPNFLENCGNPNFLENWDNPNFLENCGNPNFLENCGNPNFLENCGNPNVLENCGNPQFVSI